jgi:hypothetical protein
MYFCYIDESGTPHLPGNTSHYILAGIAIPIHRWKTCENAIFRLKKRYELVGFEIHTAWILRRYLEQSRIPNFDTLTYSQRRTEVTRHRNSELLRLQRSGNSRRYKQAKKNYKHTDAYIHLTHAERVALIEELADMIGRWNFTRIFAEAIDKIHFDPTRSRYSVDEQTLDQLVSRFERFLQIKRHTTKNNQLYGALIHDNNETVAKKHTDLMKRFHRSGTLWTQINCIIETPLFVNSELTNLIQMADLCSYAIRRYFENSETNLIDRIDPRFDRNKGVIVGLRHFTNNTCSCKYC